MRILLLIITLCTSSVATAQTLEFITGVSFTKLSIPEEPRFSNFGSSKSAPRIYLSIDDVSFTSAKKIRWRFTLGISTLSSNVRTTLGGNVAKTTFKAQSKKKLFKCRKRTDVSLNQKTTRLKLS